MERQRRTHLNRPPSPGIQPPAQPQSQPQPAPRRRRKPQNRWIMPWILRRQEKGCYSNILADLIHTDIPGYQNFVVLPPTLSTSLRNAFTTTSRSQSPISGSYWKFYSRWPKLERPTPPCSTTGWLAIPPSANSSSRSAKPSLLNSEFMNICTALITLITGKGCRISSEPDEMSPIL